MSPTGLSKRDLATAQKLFNTATITVGGLYLTSHSVAVTLIGTTAGMGVTGWSMWLEYNRSGSNSCSETSMPTSGAAGESTSDTAVDTDHG
jgi:hypothetical protein